MANIKSQKKRIRTSEVARVRNKAIRSELKTVIKHVKAAVEAGDKAAAQAAATTAYRKLDKAVAKGVIHKNQAANRKSGVQKLAPAMARAPPLRLRFPGAQPLAFIHAQPSRGGDEAFRPAYLTQCHQFPV